ncbi:MAG: ChaN family lipoprotein [Thermosynechococcaceae cyanobacterium]
MNWTRYRRWHGRSRKFCLWLCMVGVGVSLHCTAPCYAQDLGGDAAMIASFTSDQVQTLQKIRTANIIYLGETHDQPADHAAQLATLQELSRQNTPLTLALEMFQRPYQGVLDAYLAGRISEAELLDQTEYRQRWGFDWQLYAPILRWAKARQIPLLALNTPTATIRKVARNGLESLIAEDFKWIPPLADIDTRNQAYRQRMQELYDSFHRKKGNNTGFDRFFQAQVLWDETMAEAIAQSWLKFPSRQIVVLVGQGHLLYGDGIPSRVARRLQQSTTKPWQQYTVLINPPQELQGPQPRPVADFLWFTPTQP